MPLAKGDIVTCLDDESWLDGKQGQVTRVFTNGTVMVHYPLSSIPDGMYLPWEEKKAITLGYKAEELHFLRRDEHWDQGEVMTYLAGKLFGRTWFQVRYNPTPFCKGTPCEIEGCKEAAVDRSLVNFCGTVYTVDLCRVHKKQWHGHCTEAFPKLKKREG